MKSLIPLLTFLLLVSNLTAQNPPSIFGEVGFPLRQQVANQGSVSPVHNTQVLGLFADPGHITPSQGIGPKIRLGGYLWMFTTGCEVDPGTGYVRVIGNTSNNVYFHYFSLSLMSNNMWPLPLGCPGHDTIFSDPAFLAVPTMSYETMSPPSWVNSHSMVGVAVPDPYVASFTRIRIPMAPVLLNNLYTAQSYRLSNPWYPTMHASDEIVFEIGQ